MKDGKKNLLELAPYLTYNDWRSIINAICAERNHYMSKGEILLMAREKVAKAVLKWHNIPPQYPDEPNVLRLLGYDIVRRDPDKVTKARKKRTGEDWPRFSLTPRRKKLPGK